MIIKNNSREEWLEQRKRFITASDVAALLGKSPYKSREELELEKSGVTEGFAGNEHTDLALALEPWVIEQANKRFGWDIKGNSDLYVDEVYSRLAATPDGLLELNGTKFVVQVKVTRSYAQEDCKQYNKFGKPSKQAFLHGPPEHYEIQVNAEMACTGADKGILLVLHLTPLKLRTYPIERNETIIKTMRIATEMFWRKLEGYSYEQ